MKNVETRKCSGCFWYDGSSDDETAFCDEQERYVDGAYCCRFWKRSDRTKEGGFE